VQPTPAVQTITGEATGADTDTNTAANWDSNWDSNKATSCDTNTEHVNHPLPDVSRHGHETACQR